MVTRQLLFFVTLLLLKPTCTICRAFAGWKTSSNAIPGWIKVRGGSSATSEVEENESLYPALPASLNLTVHEDLLTEEECNTVITLAQQFLVASKVGRPPRVEPSLRISQSCRLPRLPVPDLWNVEKKLAQAAGVPVERGEDLQVGAYPIGNYYGMHCDERKGGRPNGGGRLATALAYLNTLDPDLATGGCTVFSGRTFDLHGEPDFPVGDIRVRELNRLCNGDDKSSVCVKPKLGRVVTFRNLAPCLIGTGDAGGGRYTFISESAHGACPVVNVTDPPAIGKDSTKFVVQQWFGLESEVSVARHPALIAHLGLGVASSFNVPPLFDLASPNGAPVAAFSSAENEDTVVQSVPSLIPNIGATRLKGWCACINSPGQNVNDLGKRGLAAALWFKLGNIESEQRLFRVGPHELSVSKEGGVVWSVGEKNVTAEGPTIVANQWYHVSLVVRPPTETLKAELYLSIPGQRPRKPAKMDITGLSTLQSIDGVSVGGYREGGRESEVDLTVTDFYAVNDDFTDKGHLFAFAIGLYDPGSGF